MIDAKIWDPNSMGIDEFEALDYARHQRRYHRYSTARFRFRSSVQERQGEGEYNPADYLPTSRYDIDTMYQELLSWIGTVKTSIFRNP